jgi:hypothetical protein
MPNRHSDDEPLKEPGKRHGEGSKSILPHLQKQTQTQIGTPEKAPDSQPQEPDKPEQE